MKLTIPIRDIAHKHGMTVGELKHELQKEKKREKNRSNKRKKRLHQFLTTKLPMDCVYYILTFMPDEITSAINRILTKDKIDRIPYILQSMEMKHIMRHFNYGCLQFLKKEIVSYEEYKTHSVVHNEYWRVSLHETFPCKFIRDDINTYEEYNAWLCRRRQPVGNDETSPYNSYNSSHYYQIYYDCVHMTDEERVKLMSRMLVYEFKKMLGPTDYSSCIYEDLEYKKKEEQKELYRSKILDKILNAFMKLPKKFGQPESKKMRFIDENSPVVTLSSIIMALK